MFEYHSKKQPSYWIEYYLDLNNFAHYFYIGNEQFSVEKQAEIIVTVQANDDEKSLKRRQSQENQQNKVISRKKKYLAIFHFHFV